MEVNAATLDFIRDNASADETALLLAGRAPKEVDLNLAVRQIALRKKLKDKIPSWCANREVIFYNTLSAEQCSSEHTARFKQQIVRKENSRTLADLTGGMGVDLWQMAQSAQHAVYVESNPELAAVTHYNFTKLSHGKEHNIEVISSDCEIIIEILPSIDLIYVDPARRSTSGKRLYDPQDCFPPVFSLQHRLLHKADKVLVKLSPMEDIRRTASLFHHLKSVYILSVHNECKELLFLLDIHHQGPYSLHCAELSRPWPSFVFTPEEESAAPHLPADDIQLAKAAYILEPGTAILKAGGFKSVAQRFGIRAISANSHLYISECEIKDFPGRQFPLAEVIPFSKANARNLGRHLTHASVTVRDAVLTVSAWCQLTGMKEGGKQYVFVSRKWIFVSR